jgi:hypothetical protein
LQEQRQIVRCLITRNPILLAQEFRSHFEQNDLRNPIFNGEKPFVVSRSFVNRTGDNSRTRFIPSY